LLTNVFGLAVFDLSMPGLNVIISQMPSTMPRGQLAVLVLVQGLILGPILGLPLTLGEEFGWRAFLLPKLLTMGRGKAIILHGIIWGVWHIPVILMGFNYPGYPIIGSFFMVIFTIIVGTFLGWIYFASGSVLVPSLAHGSLNQSAAVLTLFVVGLNPLTGDTTGVTGLLVWGMVALYLWRSGRLNVIQKEDFE
jgi:membrane protease YdiL (CAAX protease family)